MQSRNPSSGFCHGVLSILKNHRGTINKQFHVKRIGIYGSVIRGEERDDSDIDILVDFEPGQATLRNYMSLRRYLKALFSREIDLVTTGSLSVYIRPFVEREVVWIAER